jgi:hypothetical protein
MCLASGKCGMDEAHRNLTLTETPEANIERMPYRSRLSSRSSDV